jgi:3-oxoacyl-[acyl-carrier protein] reductase
MSSLKGRVALVTGGSRGIGAAIARRLASEGSSVAISYASSPDRARAVVAELEGLGVRAAAIKADQADAKQAAGLVGTVAREFGRLDILVNNAGVYVGGALGADDVDEAALQRQWAVNVHGVAAAVRAAARVLSDGGRIVTIGSCLASRTPFPGVADYSATKAALTGYTRGWARDLGARGITVNAVQPGPIATDMNPDEGDFAAMLKQATVLGRYGRPEEVAAAVVFLAGPDAGYITGTTLDVDGGMNA